MELTNYYILPGIFLTRNEIHTQMVPCGEGDMYRKTFLVNYCIDGRCEFKIDSDNYSYVDHGLMSASSQMAQGNFYIHRLIIWDMRYMSCPINSTSTQKVY